jgi:hypothetical protein
MNFRSPLAPAVVAAILGLAAAMPAQQPNGPTASLVLGAVDGPSYPILLPVNVQTWGATLSFELAGNPNRAFVLASFPAGLLPAGVGSPFGLLDSNPALGIDFLIDGLGFSPPNLLSLLATTGPSGTFSLTFPITAASPLLSTALQALVVDPASAGGLSFTAATLLTVASSPDNALFVSHSRGSLTNPGTAGFPFLTIQQAINASFAMPTPRPTVKIEAGNYNEPSLTLRSGVSLLGGLDGVSFAPLTGARSRVVLGNSTAVGQDLLLASTIARMEFVASDATGNSGASTALRLLTTSSGVSFDDCLFQAGRGGHGQNGFGGTNGSNGSAGSSGSSGGWGGFGGSFGGNGGAGGGPGSNGAPGQAGGNSGGSGGSGGAGSFCSPSNGGTGGSTFNHGVPGSGGQPNSLGGVIVGSGSWSPGSPSFALAGAAGRGGGGGGGGGGATCSLLSEGGRGGGGGGGGYGASGGQGGWNGGASFAVHLHNSSPAFSNCDFVAAQGGNGGNGGTGGNGGLGGSAAGGEAGGGNAANGGSGGSGSRGGAGGGGAAGHGGPSYALYKSGTSLPALGPGLSFTAAGGGSPGSPGAGGSSPNSGGAGAAGQVGPSGPMN